MNNVIVEVRFNNGIPTKYDYKYFQVVLTDGKIETFHYHINNPIPSKEEMFGLTWEEVIELARKMWYEAIK